MQAVTPSIQSCTSGASLFELIDNVWDGTTGAETLHRICTMMRWMHVQSVVVEESLETFAECDRIKEEIIAVERRLSRAVKCKVYKLTFLRSGTNNCVDEAEKLQKIVTSK